MWYIVFGSICFISPLERIDIIMISYLLNQILTYDKAIAQLKLIDNDLMRIVFKDRECIELILGIILERIRILMICIVKY